MNFTFARSSRPDPRAIAPACAVIAVLGLLLFPTVASAEERPASLSVRANGLILHLFDVSEDAPYFPMRFDDAGRGTVNPGLVLAWDQPLPWKWFPYLRISLAGYADCALQPAGYLGVFPLLPEFTTRHFTFAGGIGVGMAVRRSWKRHVNPDHVSSTFSDWGAIEGAVGPFGELDFRFHPEDRRWEFVISVVPGVPYVLVTSAGIRMPLG